MTDKEFQLINERDDWHAMYNHAKLENEELKKEIKEWRKNDLDVKTFYNDKCKQQQALINELKKEIKKLKK